MCSCATEWWRLVELGYEPALGAPAACGAPGPAAVTPRIIASAGDHGERGRNHPEKP